MYLNPCIDVVQLLLMLNTGAAWRLNGNTCSSYFLSRIIISVVEIKVVCQLLEVHWLLTDKFDIHAQGLLSAYLSHPFQPSPTLTQAIVYLLGKMQHQYVLHISGVWSNGLDPTGRKPVWMLGCLTWCCIAGNYNQCQVCPLKDISPYMVVTSQDNSLFAARVSHKADLDEAGLFVYLSELQH